MRDTDFSARHSRRDAPHLIGSASHFPRGKLIACFPSVVIVARDIGDDVEQRLEILERFKHTVLGISTERLRDGNNFNQAGQRNDLRVGVFDFDLLKQIDPV